MAAAPTGHTGAMLEMKSRSNDCITSAVAVSTATKKRVQTPFVSEWSYFPIKCHTLTPRKIGKEGPKTISKKKAETETSRDVALGAWPKFQ